MNRMIGIYWGVYFWKYHNPQDLAILPRYIYKLSYTILARDVCIIRTKGQINMKPTQIRREKSPEMTVIKWWMDIII